MSYSFHAWITEDAPDTPEIASKLSAALNDANVDASSNSITIGVDDWTLRGTLNDASWVAEEAGEIASFVDDVTDGQRDVLARSTARLEFAPTAGDTDDHYNTWLIASETLADLPGVVVFYPFDATLIG